MLSIILALIACGEPDELLGGADDPVTTTAPSGTLAMATRPMRDEPPPRPISKRTVPRGEPVVRDCFGRDRRDMSRGRGGGPPPPPAIMRGPGGAPSASAPAPRPSPKPRPPRKPREAQQPASAPADVFGGSSGGAGDGKDGGGIGGLLGLGSGTKGERAAAAPAAEPAVAPERTRFARETEEEAPAVADAVEMATDPEGGARRQEDKKVLEKAKPVEPMMDWGATVHLSNDDSMSLASAQRVLYAVQSGVSFAPREVRPHELLNYFSFDTVPVPSGQMFSVLGGAELDGDTLSVALAVKGAEPERLPLDLTLVIDRSCSMQAEGRMEYTKQGLNLMTDQLAQGDRIDVVLFDSGVCTPLENFVVGRDDPSLLSDVVARMQPTSSTDLDAGMREAWRIQTSRDKADVHGRNRRVMLITDAQLNSGNVNEALVSEVGRQLEDHDIRLTGIGVGRDFNDKMLDKLTEKGKGAYVYLGSEAVVERVFGPGFKSLTQTLAHDVRFALDLPDSLALERFYGEEASTNPEDIQPINYYAGTSQVFLQDLKARGGGLVRTDPVTLTITYRDAATGEPGTQVFHTTVGALTDGDTHNLHKAQALMSFSDVLMAKAMRAQPCRGPLDTYRAAAGQVPDDAEIGYTSGLLGRMCGIDMSSVVHSGVDFKVRVDSDIPISGVGLSCGGHTQSQRLSGSDTIARFETARPGRCEVVLQGMVEMRSAVEVPETGGDVRCMVRGGRLNCG